jgi:hypothetical protein
MMMADVTRRHESKGIRQSRLGQPRSQKRMRIDRRAEIAIKGGAQSTTKGASTGTDAVA